MAVPISSLSVAIQGIADFVAAQFSNEVSIVVESPQRAHERSKGADKHFLNIFFYRVSPSGFHAASHSEEANYVRLSALITPFPTEAGNAEQDAEYRILGNVLRAFNSQPVIPAVLPGNTPEVAAGGLGDGPLTDYRLQAILQTPSMEELNHIWTTQGGDLAYRLSAAYEFALVPIEPLEHRDPPASMTTAIVDLSPDTEGADAAGFIPFGEEAIAIPVGGSGAGSPDSPVDWLPILLFASAENLSNHVQVTPATAATDIAIAGPLGERVAVTVHWHRQGGGTDVQSVQAFDITALRVDRPAAVKSLSLTAPSDGDTAVVRARPADSNGQAIAGAPFANTLSIEVKP